MLIIGIDPGISGSICFLENGKIIDVVEMPTNTPVNRVDEDDEIYRTEKEKWSAIIDLIIDCQARGQPALVGTVSIEKSEILSDLLRKKKIAKKGSDLTQVSVLGAQNPV